MPQDRAGLCGPKVNADKERRIFSVSQIVQDIKLILENTFSEIWVEGEVSNFSAQASGHFYFTLKDDAAVLPAAMFARANREVKFKIENGLKVICFGKISLYGPSGKYQIIVEKIEPKGIGSLQLALEQLKERLEKEGLFAVGHKRPIPYLPSRIGIVTSLSGAAIKDMLKVLDRRFSGAQIIIRPAQVQGESAKEDIAAGIQELNLFNAGLPQEERIEVLIVGRGGGSIEDLWAFNEEVVARAIYASGIPVISAVGHERDVTVSDLVADYRAATPSVAAEIVIPKKEDLKRRLDGLRDDILRSAGDILADSKTMLDDFYHRLSRGMGNTFKLIESEFSSSQKKLILLNPKVRIEQCMIRLLELSRQAQTRIVHSLQLRQAGFLTLAEKLSSLSPLNILGRGYSITFKMPQDVLVKEAQAVVAGDTIKTKLHRGEILSRVTEVK